MLNIPEAIKQDIEEHKKRVGEYVAGTIDPTRFKAFRVPMGIYEQRERETYMTRIRAAGGLITLEQLKKVKELADLYGQGKVHFTTRQDLQLHGMTIEETVPIIEGLLEVNMITRGTGGNTPRNVASSPLSGVAVDEAFDVAPYAEETTNYLIQDPSVYNLPRKYKIAYSNSPEDTANATITDLGFIAKIKDGKKFFEVYGGGGLGGNSRVSLLLEEEIPAEEALYHVQAMRELFEAEGDRSNKHKARIRHIVHRIGEEEFRKKYKEYVAKVKQEKSLDLVIEETVEDKSHGKVTAFQSNLLYPQKQQGLYAVYVHPENGNLSTTALEEILEFLSSLSYEPSIRLTSTQAFFVRDLNGEDAEKFIELITKYISSFDIDNSIACAGASTCQLGLCLSQGLLSAIKERFKTVSEEVKSILPRIFISGCPNSCGQHQKGLIGFSGKAKRVEEGLIPMYSILLGGKVKVGETVLGTAYGDIVAKRIPEFLVELGNLQLKLGYTDFEDFIEKQKEEILALIQQYGDVEAVKQDLNVYYDFGACEKFSLKGRGPGECSTGVMDVIQLDLSNAQRDLQEFEASKNSVKLYQAGLSAARTLLILRGVDSSKEREIFQEFIKHFVDTGYVKQSVKELINYFMDFKLGDIDTLEPHIEEVKYVVDRVKALYDSLSPQLEITLAKEQEVEESAPPASQQSEVVDLRGVKCPMNFVKAKIALAKVPGGNILGFYLDDGEPIKNVPKSIEGEGHSVLSIDDQYEGYNLLLVKKKEA